MPTADMAVGMEHMNFGLIGIGGSPVEEILPNKSLGQHWLRDKSTLKKIVSYASISPKDTILEVGPGLGTLTEVLMQETNQVVAIEFDENLAEKLGKKFHNTTLKLVQSDILKYDFNELPSGYKVVANIPYYLTSHLIRLLYQTSNPPLLSVLLVQKEVAERIAAISGKMSLLSISVQLKNSVELGVVIPADMFEPPPKVDSQVVILKKIIRPEFEGIDERLFFRLVKAGFSEKRKMLRSSLAGGLGIEKEASVSLLKKASIDPNSRAESLSLHDWLNLYKISENEIVL